MVRVTVLDVVRVTESLVVAVDVKVDVGVVELVMDVVPELVNEVLSDVVGVVASQLRNDPSWYACVRVLRAAAVLVQSALSNRNLPKAHCAAVDPRVLPGPRCSLIAALMAVAVCGHVLASTSSPDFEAGPCRHTIFPTGVGQAASARLSMSTCASQLTGKRTASSLGCDDRQ